MKIFLSSRTTSTHMVILKMEVNSGHALRIALIGKTGVGKSALGNTLLGTKVFKSQYGSKSLTEKCAVAGEKACLDGKLIKIADTPGIMDTERSYKTIRDEVQKAIGWLSPGPHAFLLVIRVGRQTKEDLEVFKTFHEMLGESMFKHTIVVFTHFDHWKDTDGKTKGDSIEDFIKTLPEAASNFIKRIKNRYAAVNTEVSKEESESIALMFEIEHMIKENGNSFYSCEQFIDSTTIQKRKERLERNENRRQSKNTNGKEAKPKNRRQAKPKNRRQAKQKNKRQLSKTRGYLLNEFRRTRCSVEKVMNAPIGRHSNGMSFYRI